MIKLSPTEFELIQELALHPGKIFTHEALLRRVWGQTITANANTCASTLAACAASSKTTPPAPHIF